MITLRGKPGVALLPAVPSNNEPRKAPWGRSLLSPTAAILRF